MLDYRLAVLDHAVADLRRQVLEVLGEHVGAPGRRADRVDEGAFLSHLEHGIRQIGRLGPHLLDAVDAPAPPLGPLGAPPVLRRLVPLLLADCLAPAVLLLVA